MARKTTTNRAATQRQSRAEAARAERMERLDGLREEQEKHAAILRGDAPRDELIKADHAFRESWRAQQRLIYPEIYRVADERLAEGGEPSAQPGAPMGAFYEHPIGLEPGHDPTVQRRFAELVDDEDFPANQTAGADNQPPGSNRVTTVPTEAGDDESVTPLSVEGAKEEADAAKKK